MRYASVKKCQDLIMILKSRYIRSLSCLIKALAVVFLFQHPLVYKYCILSFCKHRTHAVLWNSLRKFHISSCNIFHIFRCCIAIFRPDLSICNEHNDSYMYVPIPKHFSVARLQLQPFNINLIFGCLLFCLIVSFAATSIPKYIYFN